MKAAPFDYLEPETVAEAVSLLEKHGDEAKILAGGQSLIPLLNMRLARPEVLIDIGRLRELEGIREIDGGLAIGAMTTKRAVEDSELVLKRQPLLHAATLLIGHPQIRNRGTVGGSMAQADPAAEYPAVAVALDAELRVVGPKGERAIAAGDFFVTYLTTALQPDELLTEIRFPALSGGTGWSVAETARRHGDFAMTGAVTSLGIESGDRCSDVRIVLFGVGATPVRARQAEEMVNGERPDDELFARAARTAGEEIEEPLSDIHASGEYRRQLAQMLTRKALAEAVARAGREG